MDVLPKLAILTSAALAAAAAAPPAWAQLEWEETKAEIVAPLGAPTVTHRYPFRNAGEHAVEIKKVSTNCDCLTATASREIVAPGESAEIVAVFSVGERTGRRSSRITVVSTAPKPVTVLGHRIELRQEVDFSKKFVRFSAEEGEGGLAPEEVVVRLHPESARKLKGARCEDERFEVALRKGEKPGEFILRIDPMGDAEPRRAIVFLETEPAPAEPKQFAVFTLVR